MLTHGSDGAGSVRRRSLPKPPRKSPRTSGLSTGFAGSPSVTDPRTPARARVLRQGSQRVRWVGTLAGERFVETPANDGRFAASRKINREAARYCDVHEAEFPHTREPARSAQSGISLEKSHRTNSTDRQVRRHSACKASPGSRSTTGRGRAPSRLDPRQRGSCGDQRRARGRLFTASTSFDQDNASEFVRRVVFRPDTPEIIQPSIDRAS